MRYIIVNYGITNPYIIHKVCDVQVVQSEYIKLQKNIYINIYKINTFWKQNTIKIN